MSTIKRISSRGYVVAETIAKRETFKTSGALQGRVENGMGTYEYGQLAGEDCAAFMAEAHLIKYVVFSYATPIAWYTVENGWYKVRQKFSATTSRHQGRLYMIDEGGH